MFSNQCLGFTVADINYSLLSSVCSCLNWWKLATCYCGLSIVTRTCSNKPSRINSSTVCLEKATFHWVTPDIDPTLGCNWIDTTPAALSEKYWMLF